MRTLLSLALALGLAACESKNAYDPKGHVDAGKPPPLQGQDPDKFACDKLVGLGDVAAVAGGEVEPVDSAYTMPQGTPKPCIYALKSDETKTWGVQLDCRDRAIADMEQLMRTKSADEATHELPGVGKKAIEHDNARVAAIDDDTPCTILVVGPDADSRAALARLVVQKLTLANAPTRPHPQARAR